MLKTEEIFSISNKKVFKEKMLEIFKFQAENNIIYKEYLSLRKVQVNKIKSIQDIPFLPIEFFKKYKIVSSTKHPDAVFTSSGTTSKSTSLHYITNISVYKKSLKKCFEIFYGSAQKYCFLALLPSYLDHKDSSLVFMVNELMKLSKYDKCGFYLNNYDELKNMLFSLEKNNIPVILIGVSFALLDFVEKHPIHLKNCTIMETGGMKGRRTEITRNELHEILKKGFGVRQIHSEYGMTELLSQAYSKGNGEYFAPPWMKVLIRDIYDPLNYLEKGKTGGINIIDLANINSISFIETQDIGKICRNGSFEVLGRLEQSDVRGCNLLYNE